MTSIHTSTKKYCFPEKCHLHEGFTLIELLVSIVIIGALSAIALPSYLNQAAKAKGSEAKSSLGLVNRAQQAYRYEQGRFSQNLPALNAFGIALPNKHYTYSITGVTNTATIEADPTRTDYKVYSAGVALGADDRFAQVICESFDLKGATSNNTATANPQAGSTASADCTTSKLIQ
jgi:type IV pilus assembly protein PilA